MNAPAKTDIRLACVQMMQELQSRGGSLTRLLPAAQARVADAEKAQLQAWAYGFARFSGELRGLVDQLLDKPLKPKDLDVYLLMQLGIYQLRHTSTAGHAAVDETVKVVKRLKKPWARGLVNAVLRNYQRQHAKLESRLSDEQRWSHPAWMLEQLQSDWPDQWQAICTANNTQAPMTLRVNVQRGEVAHYQRRLEDAGMQASTVEGAPQALQLSSAVPVSQLPGFADGEVSVQDAAAQRAGLHLVTNTPAGGRLLDACAAPGGKTAHVLEMDHFSSVLALDHDADRLSRVDETLQRLQLSEAASTQVADAADTEHWWDGVPFQAILLDAPCTGLGVVRRHPDIKLLRRSSDVAALCELQARLLDALWRTLDTQGVLVYATCSVLKQENEHQVKAFLDRTKDASLVGELHQILPGQQGMDGFFFAALAKR